jgi:hypothetical protein
VGPADRSCYLTDEWGCPDREPDHRHRLRRARARDQGADGADRRVAHGICPPGATAATALQESAVTAFRALGLRDYARFDFRLAADGTPYLIEANPNPHLHSSSEFARAARAAGRTHPRTIREIVEHARSRERRADTLAAAIV